MRFVDFLKRHVKFKEFEAFFKFFTGGGAALAILLVEVVGEGR